MPTVTPPSYLRLFLAKPRQRAAMKEFLSTLAADPAWEPELSSLTMGELDPLHELLTVLEFDPPPQHVGAVASYLADRHKYILARDFVVLLVSEPMTLCKPPVSGEGWEVVKELVDENLLIGTITALGSEARGGQFALTDYGADLLTRHFALTATAA